MKTLNKLEFYEEIQKNKVILVDFYAVWCGPCRMQAPILEEVEEHYFDNKNVMICKLDIDENNEIAIENGVMSIPTLIIFKNGKMLEKIIGLTDKEDIIEKINLYL